MYFCDHSHRVRWTRRSSAFVLSPVFMIALFCAGTGARAQEIYQVTQDGERGIDLNALGDGYRKDCFAGPDAGIVSVTGKVTHAQLPAGEALGLVGKGGTLRMWQTGLIQEDKLVVPIRISGSGTFDFYVDTCRLENDWAKMIRFAPSTLSILRFNRFHVKNVGEEPLLFNPDGAIYVTQQASFGMDGGETTVVFNNPYGAYQSHDTSSHDNRYIDTYIGGASSPSSPAGYTKFIYKSQRDSGSLGVLHFGRNLSAQNSRQQSEALTNTFELATASWPRVLNLKRYGTDCCLIRFAGGGDSTFFQPGWHGEMFLSEEDPNQEGRFIIEAARGSNMGFRLSNGKLGSSSVVEFRGKGDVLLRCGDSLVFPTTIYNRNGEKILWNQEGDLKLTFPGNRCCLRVGEENVFPFGPGQGNVMVDSSTYLWVEGVDQRFNSLYGGGPVYQTSEQKTTFTVGENGEDCVYDVQAPTRPQVFGPEQKTYENRGWNLRKIGAGELTVRKPWPKSLSVLAGGVRLETELDLAEADFGEGTYLTIDHVTASAGGQVTGLRDLRLENGAVWEIGGTGADTTFDLSTLSGQPGTVLRKVGNNRVTFTGSSLFNGSLEIEGGSVVFAAGAKLPNVLRMLRLASGTTLDLPEECVIRVVALEELGTQTGSGAIVVVPDQAIWTGQGADDDPSTAANWKALEEPLDFNNAHFSPIFAEGDNSGKMDIPLPLQFRGISFIPALTEAFTLSQSSPDGSISLGNAGISSPEDRKEPLSIRIHSPLTLNESQTWRLGEKVRVTVDGSLKGAGDLVKEGKGEIVFNTDGSSTKGKIRIEDGYLYASGKAPLGSRDIWINSDGSLNGARLVLNNAEIRGRVTRINGNYEYRNGIETLEATTNTFWEKVEDATCARLVVGKNSLLTFAGGYHTQYANWWNFEGTVIVTNKPLDIGPFEGACNHLILYTKNNRFIRLKNCVEYPQDCINVFFDLRTDYALNSDEMDLHLSSDIEMNGHDQRVGSLRLEGGKKVRSTGGPATLYVRQNLPPPLPMQGAFVDGVSLVKSGPQPLELTAVHSSTGNISVVEGELRFSEGASWKGAGKVSVQGIMSCSSPETFSRETDIEFNSPGQMKLNFSGAQKMRNLYFDGVKQPRGTYGSSQSNAAFKDDSRFMGTGVLNVLGDKQWMLLFLK